MKKILSYQIRYYLNSNLKRCFWGALKKVCKGHDNAFLWCFGESEISAQSVLNGYLQGFFIFPNSYNFNNLEWHNPSLRAIIPINNFKVRDKTKKLYDNNSFEIKEDTCFSNVLEECSKPRKKNNKTWLTPSLIDSLIKLNKLGFAHCIEVYKDGELVGGEIGLAINGLYVGLSSFHKIDNSSKIALYYVLNKLQRLNYIVHDCGYKSKWLDEFGVIFVSKEEYNSLLLKALNTNIKFTESLS